MFISVDIWCVCDYTVVVENKREQKRRENKMTKDELSMVGFEIVAYSGDARSTLLELLKEMRAGNFDNVEEKLKDADANINLAHQSQTTILQQEARGEDMEMGFIFIHGQDHLMTTILLRDVIEDFITLYKERGTK